MFKLVSRLSSRLHSAAARTRPYAINKHRGFTLIELAIVMAVIGLLVGGLVVPLSKRLEMQAYADTQAHLDKAVEALTGFAILNGRLPCPASDGRGLELTPTPENAPTLCGAADHSDDASNSANTSWGHLPWSTLGIAPGDGADAWGYQLRYAVRTNLATGVAGANLLTATKLTQNGIGVFDPNSNAPVIAPDKNGALFVVYSLGKNHAGATLLSTAASGSNTATPSPSSPNELANLPNLSSKTIASTAAAPSAANTLTTRNIFVATTRSDDLDPDTPVNYYDDLLVWMSPATLISKLAAVNRYSP